VSYKPGQTWRHKPELSVMTVMIVEVYRLGGQTYIGVDTVDGRRDICEDEFLYKYELVPPRTTWDRLLITEEEF